jgi:hypothetical protein
MVEAASKIVDHVWVNVNGSDYSDLKLEVTKVKDSLRSIFDFL